MSLFSKKQGLPSIRDRVMQAINEKIDNLEESFRLQCQEIDDRAAMEKIKAGDAHVESIIGKIL